MTDAWLLVAGDFTPLGGMDAANYALARHLARRGSNLHIVTHRAWPDLAEMRAVTLHPAWRPFGKHALGGPMLARAGRRVLRDLRAGAPSAHAIANGGNCQLSDVNWVHYLHAAYQSPPHGSAARQAKTALVHRRDVAAERTALERARLVISNSQRTKRDVVERVGVPEERVHVVYYGSDPVRLSYVSDAQRRDAKRALGRTAERPIVGFVGALGDRRKAFDTIFDAWVVLSRHKEWDADLIAVGAGAALASWKARAAAAGLESRVTFLGFRHDVPDLLAAFDALVHPARYEAYGLSVHEALTRGVPALVSAHAGVAEMYPNSLAELLVANPDDAGELAERLMGWRRGLERFRGLTEPVSAALRARTWDQMAREIIERVECA